MDPLAVILVLVAVALTVAVVATPLREGRADEDEREHEAEVADLEAAKAARYREIREAEMDFRTGKLSEADWRAIDRELRAEAVEVLRRLDRLGVHAPQSAAEALAEPAPHEPDALAEPMAEQRAERVGQPPAA
jgi:flagellar biosynthesis/type III secretory pathway M-ring protein FliF/YscJ